MKMKSINTFHILIKQLWSQNDFWVNNIITDTRGACGGMFYIYINIYIHAHIKTHIIIIKVFIKL